MESLIIGADTRIESRKGRVLLGGSLRVGCVEDFQVPMLEERYYGVGGLELR
jgi:hypothetical protein